MRKKDSGKHPIKMRHPEKTQRVLSAGISTKSKHLSSLRSLLTLRNALYCSMIFFIVILLVIGFYVMTMEDRQQKIVLYLENLQTLGSLAPFVFIAVHALAVSICFPATILFEFSAGLLFGFLGGVFYVSIGKTIGATIGFGLGKTLLRSHVAKWIEKFPTFVSIYSNMEVDQWKIAFLLRLSPFPSWLINYGLALSPVNFSVFIIATLVGGLVTIMQNVYFGTAVGSVANLVSGESSHNSRMQELLKTASLLLGVLCAFITTRLFVRYIQSALKVDEKSER